MKRRIIGIDVGKNGGIVVYDTENNKLLECIKMPPTPKDLLDFLSKNKRGRSTLSGHAIHSFQITNAIFFVYGEKI